VGRHAWGGRDGKSAGVSPDRLTEGTIAYWAWLAYWSRHEVEQHEKVVTKRLAFVTRYTSITLTEALSCDVYWLGLFADCVAEIVREENAAHRPGG
jgi:hypothetical protein